MILNTDEVKNSINQFLEDKLEDKLEWDVLILSANNYRPFEKTSNYIKVTKRTMYERIYIVRRHYYETLIQIWETAIIQFFSKSRTTRHICLRPILENTTKKG